MGAERTRPVLEWLTPSGGCVISAGFAGALTDGPRVGDVVVADEVVDEGGECWPTATAGGGRRLLTVGHLVGDPAEKRRLGERYRAEVVDMESAIVARHCAGRGIPFLAVRAVSDEVGTELSPQLIGLLGGAHVSALRLAAGMVRSPGIVKELWQLAAATRTAARNLADVLAPLAVRFAASGCPAEGSDRPLPPHGGFSTPFRADGGSS